MPFCRLKFTAPKLPDPKLPQNPVSLGDHLRKVRIERGLSQPQAARLLGVSDETVTNWETNHTQPGAKMTGKIIAFLGYDPRPEPESLGARLRHARHRLGLTHTEAARRIGVDPSAILDWEKGRHVPTAESMGSIGRLMGAATACDPLREQKSKR